MAITPLVIELADQYRAALLARERQAASAMVRYYGLIWQDLQTQINALDAEIQSLRASGGIASADKITRLTRTRNVQTQVAQELDKFSDVAGGVISAAQREAIAAGERDAYNLTLAAFPQGSVSINFWRMPVGAVETMVGFVADGTPLNDLIRGYVGEAAESFLDELVKGLAEGKNPRAIASILRQEFGMGLTKSLLITRTEQLRAYRTATLGSYNDSGVVKGWQRHAAKGERTCMACIVLDGKVYDLATEMDDHPNGRCSMLPITKTYAEMGIDAPEPTFQDETAREWFERQEEATQRGMMGGGMFDAWRDGRFTLDNIPKIVNNKVWGDSWTPAPLYELLGADGPVGSYELWAAGQE